MPDENLAKHTRIVMWGLIIPVVNVICGIWALLLIGRHRKGLREAARLARWTLAAGGAPANLATS